MRNNIIIIMILSIMCSVSIFASDLVLKDARYLYRIPEEYLDSQLEFVAPALSRHRMHSMYFFITGDELVLGGKYRWLPFRVYFTVLRESPRTYRIIIKRFKFFDLIRYSTRKLVDRLYNALSKDEQTAQYVRVSKKDGYIVIKLKKELYEIFPAKYRQTLTPGVEK